MNVYALLSWYDEKPAHLQRCISSLVGLVDHVIALDGAYATFPNAKRNSPMAQHHTILDAAQRAGMGCTIGTLPFATEVAKRAGLFDLARLEGATESDWLLIIDADTYATHIDVAARFLLQASSMDTAQVTMINATDRQQFRSLFRALPGLTVERTHWLYTVPEGTARRFLWHMPDGNMSDEPCMDLAWHLTLTHDRADRVPERNAAALEYYVHRDENKLESAGEWAQAPPIF